MQPSLAIDLDGVIVAFFEEVIIDYNDLPEVKSGQVKPLQIEEIDYDFSKLDKQVAARMRAIFTAPGFFLKVKPISSAPDIVNKLREERGCAGIICTAPSRNAADQVLAHSASEKITWVQKYLPLWGNNVMITQDKHYAAADMLIDDYPPNIEKWCEENPNGVGFLVEQPWNARYRSSAPYTPINKVSGTLAEVDSFIAKFWCPEEGRFAYKSSELRKWFH